MTQPPEGSIPPDPFEKRDESAPTGDYSPPESSGYPAPDQPGGFAPPPGFPSPPSYPDAPPPAPGYGYGQPPAGMGPTGMVPPGMYFDPASGLTLPNATELASVGRRIGAYFLAIPLFIVTLGIGYIIWGLVLWGRGQTPASKVLGMTCWDPAANKVPGFGRMALREIVGRFVEGILSVITLLISFVLFLTNNQHKSLHDMIGGTVVLHDPNKVLA